VAQPNAWSRVLQTKNTNPNQQHDATMMNTNSTRRLTNENYGSKGYMTAKSVYFFGFFGGAWYKDKMNYKAHENTSHAT
jgi:hypothetical protein